MFNIKALRDQGYSIRAIARTTGYDKKTVAKYIKAQQAPRYKPRPLAVSKLEPFKGLVLCRMAEGVYNCEVLLDELRAAGYQGGKSVLKEFVKPHRPARLPLAVMRYEPPPGELAQANWGVFAWEDEQGNVHRVYAFAFVLCYSRVHYVEFVERMDLDTLLRCHLNAFAAVGGIPRTILYDNMKQVVLGRDEDGEPQWNTRFADFGVLLGFRPRACRPYRAQTKGRVERVIRYLRQNFWPGRRFTDLADLNRQARAWCDKTNRRRHGTTHQIPLEALAHENLLPLPQRLAVEHLLGEERTVSRDGFVSWGGARYGVPWPYAGSTVVVNERGELVEFGPRAAMSESWCTHERPKAGS